MTITWVIMGMSAVVDDAHQPRAIVAVPLVPPAPDLLGWPQLRGSLALITEPPPRVIASVSEVIGTYVDVRQQYYQHT